MSTKQIFILAIISLVVIASIAGVVLKFVVFNDDDEQVKKETYYYEDDQMNCNIKETSRIIRLKIVIETTDKKLVDELENKNFLIKDKTNEIVRSKTYEELEGSEGQIALQKELIVQLNKVFETEKIVDVYFDEFIIQ